MGTYRVARIALSLGFLALVWHSTGHAPSALSDVLDRANHAVVSLMPGTGAPPEKLGQWRTCQTIRVYASANPATQAHEADIEQAVAIARKASGLPLAYAGVSAGTTGNAPTQASVTENQDENTIVIAWTNPRNSDLLTPTRIGGTQLRTNPKGRITAAGIAINTEQARKYAEGYGPGRTMGNVLLHEMGHALGLPHSDADTLMRETVDGASPDGYTEADLENLSALARNCGD